MKLLAILLSGVIGFTWSLDANAGQRRHKYRTKNHSVHYYRLPNSVLPGTLQYGPCGLRDHGAPITALSLNNRCDQEEFWRRMEERGRGRH